MHHTTTSWNGAQCQRAERHKHRKLRPTHSPVPAPAFSHTDCHATHCELFGGPPRVPGVAADYAANFYYKGQRYSAPILATVTVSGLNGAAPDPVLPNTPVCRSK